MHTETATPAPKIYCTSSPHHTASAVCLLFLYHEGNGWGDICSRGDLKFVTVLSSAMGTFVKKVKGPLVNKTLQTTVSCPEVGAKVLPLCSP